MLSPDLMRFIRRNISSVEQLEILLLLFEEPEREWSAEGISEHLRSSLTSVTKRLGDLERRQLVERTSGETYRYRPSTRAEGVLKLMRDEYHIRPTRVIDAIFSVPGEAISSFADAFRLRPEDTDDR